jgi:cell division septation protein DedD
MSQDTERSSTRSLLGAFFLVVLLCAVFFSLGYFLGYKERGPAASLVSEQVIPPADSDVPPPANPSTQTASPAESPTGQEAPTPATRPSDAGSAASASSTDQSAGGGSATNANPAGAASKPASKSESPAASDATAGRPADAAALERKRVPRGLLVQAAALSNEQDAANTVNVLTSRGYPAFILTPRQAHAGDRYYRVVVGPYRTHAAAEAGRDKLSAEGFKPFIRQ